MLDFNQITKQLIDALDSLKLVYEDGQESSRDHEFFFHVKQETERYFTLLETWKNHALILSQERKISIHPGQVDATVDNMTALIMHSYYKDARKRQYMEISKSCHLVFLQSIGE